MADEQVPATPAAPAGERRYQAMLEKLTKQARAVEVNNLRRYHSMGLLFTEFVNGLDSKKYGSATVERLSQDLADSGVLNDVRDPTRFLYWSKNLSDCYPDFEDLEEMSRLGFTVSHAKHLFTLAPEIRQRVERQMVRDGRMISTRELADLVSELNTQIKLENSQAAAEESRARREGTDDQEQPAETADTPAEQVAGAGDAPAEPAEADEPGNPELPTPEAGDRPEGVPATGAPTRERTIRSPLKVLRGIEKSMMQVHTGLADTFIVVRESAQIGFDSDTAHTKYVDQLRKVRTASQAMIEPVQELLRTLSEEIDAAEVPTGET
jgi:hypothetical protein